MTKKAKITVIIPVYNVEKFLRTCLDSVMNQTYQNLEIICVNEGSTDSSPEILKEYFEKDDRIIIINKENGGLSSARNAGLDAATGEYVAFLDSDDWISKNFCKELLKSIIKTHSDAAIAQTHYVYENRIEKNHYVNFFTHKKNKTKLISKIKNKQNIIYSCACWNKLYKRSIIEKYHLRFPEGLYIEDVPFNFAFTMISKQLCIVQNAILYYRQQNESIMVKAKNSTIPFDIFKIYEECEKYLVNIMEFSPKQKEYRKILDNFIIFNALGWLKTSNKKYRIDFVKKLKNRYSKINIQNNNYISISDKKIYNAIMYSTDIQDTIDLIVYGDIKDYLKKIEQYKDSKIVFWGASLFLEKCLECGNLKDFNIVGIVDKDIKKHGKHFSDIIYRHLKKLIR